MTRRDADTQIVLRSYARGELTYTDAMGQLNRLGYTADQAWQMLREL